MNRIFASVIVFLCFFNGYLMNLGAVDRLDSMISLRFYQGVRIPQDAKPEVTLSLQARPFFVGQIMCKVPIKEELEELKRIFNLSQITLIEQNQMVWEQGVKASPTIDLQLTLVNDDQTERTFKITLQPSAERDRFKVKVCSLNPLEPTLLETDLTLPQEQSTVLGFDDLKKVPYFISLNRSPNSKMLPPPNSIGTDVSTILSAGKSLKPTFQVPPRYPEAAKKAGLQGTVRLKAFVNSNGTIQDVEVFQGHPQLTSAAMEAVRTWRFEPFQLENRRKLLPIVIRIQFGLPQDQLLEGKIPSMWPTQGLLTDGFGLRLHPITGKKEMHEGQDIAVARGRGSSVLSTAVGTVIFAGEKGDYGNTVVIEHADGYTTLYAKLNKILVAVGETVHAGQQIATVGNSGAGTVPHLHYEVHLNGRPVNPMDYVGN